MPDPVNAEQVKQQAIALGFHKVGIAAVYPEGHSPADPVSDPVPHPQSDLNVARLQTWLNQGYQADMQWMTHPNRQRITSVMADVQSVICVALNYYVPVQRPDDPRLGKIARYAWGRDYHKVMSRRLKALSHWLEAQDPGIKTRFYVDTGPIQDKVWAEQAGLGWIAKNSNLITREYGSWIFLGEILTNVSLTPDRPHTQHCGTCRRCIESCPTGAIAAPFVVDANRCIAYHTLENRAEQLPDEIVGDLHGWIAGCDICQEVCPWNRFAQPTTVDDFQPRSECLAPVLADLAQLTDAAYLHQFQGSTLRRVKPHMWRRNARAGLNSRPQS